MGGWCLFTCSKQICELNHYKSSNTFGAHQVKRNDYYRKAKFRVLQLLGSC